MKITRRNFLKGSLATLFLAGSGIPVYSATKTKKNLVVVMLRGGMDALCAVPVIGDKDLTKRRAHTIVFFRRIEGKTIESGFSKF